MREMLYVLRWGISGESLGVFSTPTQARAFAERREGEVLAWRESNSHGLMWIAVQGDTEKFVVEETPFYQEA